MNPINYKKLIKAIKRLNPKTMIRMNEWNDNRKY